VQIKPKPTREHQNLGCSFLICVGLVLALWVMAGFGYAVAYVLGGFVGVMFSGDAIKAGVLNGTQTPR
jgi:hypothetical protein